MDCGVLRGAYAGGSFGWAEIENEILAYQEDSDLGLISFALIVGGGGEVGLGVDWGEDPGFAAVAGEGKVGAVLAGMFVVAAGDYAVIGIAESDGEDSGGVGAVEDWSVEDLPGLAAIGGVEDAGCFAACSEPDVGVGG